MNPTLTPQEATAQEIQLELIRRTKFNTFDGQRVCALLHPRRGLWRAVLFDRPGVPDCTRPGALVTSGLIKLRDLEDNIWNADTLFVLTPSAAHARELASAFEQAGMGAMPRVHEDVDETDRALGTGRQKYGLLSVWWD